MAHAMPLNKFHKRMYNSVFDISVKKLNCFDILKMWIQNNTLSSVASSTLPGEKSKRPVPGMLELPVRHVPLPVKLKGKMLLNIKHKATTKGKKSMLEKLLQENQAKKKICNICG